jgi:L-glyceraldehyde 3-phosphate reductase
VDIFYHHRPDPDTPLEETLGALDQAVRSGKALYAGISSYNAETTRMAASIMKDLGTPCLIHQPKYNMLDRWIEGDLQHVLNDEGIGCIPFSPLAQGLLTDRYLSGIPDDSRAAKEHGFLQKESITGELLERIEKLNSIAQRRGQSLAQMSLAWVLRLKEVTSVLIGASSTEQIDDNLRAWNNKNFSGEELDEIEHCLKR